MLAPKPNALEKNQKPRWTHDESIAFECAREAIGQMISICSYELHQERKKLEPNLEKIDLLKKQQSDFADERRNLHLHQHENIARIRKEYGSQIRSYMENLKKDLNA